jgi:hypothetical protein
MVREATGRPVAVDAHPKHTMAMGAAYVAEQQRAATASAAPTSGAVTAVAPIADVAEEIAAPEPEPGPATALEAPPPPTGPSGGVRTRRAVPVGLALVAAAVIAAVAIGANLLGGSGGAGSSPTVQPSIAVVASPSPSASPPPSPSPTPIPTPTPTPEPTPTPTPSGPRAEITRIRIVDADYAVSYKAIGFTPDIPGVRHVHFFFDTIPPTEAGKPADPRNWILYDGKSPFRGYQVSDRPKGARQMCILVAKHDHSVIQGTGNCFDLPS